MIRVAVSTLGGAADNPRVWSGTPAGIVAAMRRSTTIEPLLLDPPAPRLHLAGRRISAITKRLPGNHKINWETEPTLTRRLGQALVGAAASLPDIDLALAVGWEPLVSSARLPVVMWGDGTYAQRVDSSPHWSHLGQRTRRTLVSGEGAALRSLDAVVMASDWAARDVVERYGVDAAKVHVVPLGANIATPPALVRPAPIGPIRLLAAGVEWHRKGMDVAVATADELRRRGHDVTLDIVGLVAPDASWERPHVIYRGFLSKRDAAQAQQLNALYADAHVFLFPTRDDPYGVVLCEAAAFGLPVVAPRHNAIPEIVEDGVTGRLVDEGADASAYADAAEAITASDDGYVGYARAARDAFESRLNWDASIDRLARVLGSLS